MRHACALVTLLVVVLVACASPATPLPTPTSTPTLTATATSTPTATPLPTPNLQATVDSMVQRRVSDILTTNRTPTAKPTATPLPTPVPQYWPTPEDFNALAFNRIGALPSTDVYMYRQYASVYIASECLAEKEMSFDGFRTFLNQPLLMVRTTDSDPMIKVIARDVIAQITRTAEARTNLGSTPSVSNCLRPYLYPESATEAALAIELVDGLAPLSEVSRDSRDIVASIRQQFAYKWFGSPEAQERPFLPWYCENAAFVECP